MKPVPLCGVCCAEPAALWREADVHYMDMTVVNIDNEDVCLGCAASNFTLLCCSDCRDVVAALVDYEFVEAP